MKVHKQSVADFRECFSRDTVFAKTQIEVVREVHPVLGGKLESGYDDCDITIIMRRLLAQPMFESSTYADAGLRAEAIGLGSRCVRAGLSELDHHIYPELIIEAVCQEMDSRCESLDERCEPPDKKKASRIPRYVQKLYELVKKYGQDEVI